MYSTSVVLFTTVDSGHMFPKPVVLLTDVINIMPSIFNFLCCNFCSVCVCRFASKGGDESYVLVGTANDMILSPRTCSGGAIHTYKLITFPDGSGQKLELLHKVD